MVLKIIELGGDYMKKNAQVIINIDLNIRV